MKEFLKKIKIGSKYIGEGEPCFIVAEIGQNHNGDIRIAKKLIDLAVKYKVDAVKFCKRDLDTELTKAAYNAPYIGPNSFGKTYGKHREKLEFSPKQFRELSDYCKKKRIIFFASVCGPKSVDLLDKLGSPLFKIASRDLTNLPLVKHIAKKGKPIILSTGMSTLREIEESVSTIKKYNNQLIILKCTSEYPCPHEHVNLRAMDFLRKKFKVPVGFSDHTIGIVATPVAVALGAVLVEKHITLSRSMKGSDHKGSLGPDGLWRTVRDVRNIEKAMGKPEINMLSLEMKSRGKLARSIVAKANIKKGTKITNDMLVMKSPGTGLSAHYIPYFIGKIAKQDLKIDHILSKSDVK